MEPGKTPSPWLRKKELSLERQASAGVISAITSYKRNQLSIKIRGGYSARIPLHAGLYVC